MDQATLDQFLATIPAMSIEKRVKLYIRTRSAKSAAQKVFDEQEAQFKVIMDLCENTMLREADTQGVTGFTTPWGTTYAAETMKLSIADDTAFEGFLRAQANPFLFFERRISSTHVQKFMELSGGLLPPGLNAFRERVMRVRKAGDK